MASLVLELQQEALNTGSSVANLLRMAFVVARKLGVSDFEKWVSAEMNGYKDGMDIPDYRILAGSVKVFNPYHGWQPLRFGDPKWADRLSKRQIPDSIAKLENMLNDNTSKPGEFMVTFVPEVEKDLMDAMSPPRLQPATAIGSAAVQAIVDTVRNTVLDWSLKLEASGVLGENMTFSEEEKSRAPAPATPASVAYYAQTQTVIHGMQQSQIQQATTDSTQTFVQAPPDLAAVAALMTELRGQLASLNLSPELRGEIEADMLTVEAQAKSPKPRFAIIRETMHSMRSVLEQAAGGVVAAGLLAEFTRLLS
ncbi:AbiTii domain-containing protein [Paraburkholderia sp. RL17-347-BIC-D]|uniref:AbiTii domain-containing protein n=1 Tax=Paraburkholderia sp. RL17-347-BIC-D TaxID=3031632 RepID=UPI0038BC4C4B